MLSNDQLLFPEGPMSLKRDFFQLSWLSQNCTTVTQLLTKDKSAFPLDIGFLASYFTREPKLLTD